MTIQYIFNYLFTLRDLNVFSGKRPLAHFRKKGPGRKHQQGKR